jgi:hypothetical protein
MSPHLALSGDFEEPLATTMLLFFFVAQQMIATG